MSDADLRDVRVAGFTDAQIIEVVQHVALNTWTNYINSVAKLDDAEIAANRATFRPRQV